MQDLVQVMLRDERNGRMTVNVPTKPQFSEGDHITLKNSDHPDKLWLVTWKSQYPRPADTVHRNWHNNI